MSQRKPPRITPSHIWHEFLGTLNWDKGFLYTVQVLALRPGYAIRDYLRGDRGRYFNPVRFLVLTAAVSTLLLTELSLFEQISTIQAESTNEGDIAFRETFLTFFTKYLNIFQLISVPVFALFSWLFFQRQEYNYAEHLTMNAYVLGESAVIYIMLIPVAYYNINVYLLLTGISFIYYLWAYASFFGSKRVSTFVRSLISVSLSYSVFILVEVVVAVIYINLTTDQ